jgi:hypothetical protein
MFVDTVRGSRKWHKAVSLAILHFIKSNYFSLTIDAVRPSLRGFTCQKPLTVLFLGNREFLYQNSDFRGFSCTVHAVLRTMMLGVMFEVPAFVGLYTLTLLVASASRYLNWLASGL